MLKEKPLLDPGFARRLCSGSLLQFVTREDFYDNEIPSLGFYGHREYMVQNYSCSASPFPDVSAIHLPWHCLMILLSGLPKKTKDSGKDWVPIPE